MGLFEVPVRLYQNKLKVEKLRHRKNIDQLLHDKSFILWCLFPTEESDKQWKEDYLSLYPEEAETLEQAKEKICRLQFNHTRLTLAEKKALKQRVLDSYDKQRKFRIIRFGWLSAAACLLLLCLLGPLYLQFREESETESATMLLADVKVDPEQEEIELYLSEEKIQVTDNSTISVDKKGNVQVADENLQSVDTIKHLVQEEDKNHHLNLLSVPNGKRSSLILSDGTKVWVNSGTVLQFPETFAKGKRELYVKGEIYIEVAKNSEWPFYVKTDGMEVQVLGTSFGFTAYDDEESRSLVLKEGSVMVKNSLGNGQVIRPNQRLTVEGENMVVSEVNVDDYLSWVEGVLQFHNKTLQEVLRSLSRYYRVRFDCSAEIGQMKCSGNLVLFDHIDQVLQTLQKTLSVSFKHEEDIIIIESNKQ